jgi:hypothetical protein
MAACSFSQENHNEQREEPAGPGGSSAYLHVDPLVHPLSSGRSALPHLQENQGVLGKTGLQHDGLAREQPDLNPVENLWNIMKQRLKTKDIGFGPKLQAKLKKLWVILGIQPCWAI